MLNNTASLTKKEIQVAVFIIWASLVSDGKESTCNVGDLGSIPELGRSLVEENGYPRQYSDTENSLDCI